MEGNRAFIFRLSIALLVGILFSGLELVDPGFEARKPNFVQTLELSWRGLKQKVQREWINPDLKPADIQILSLDYDDRQDFWSDQETKKKLVEKLMLYPGPFVVALDPLQILKDPILNRLYENPKMIRTIRLDPGSPDNVELGKSLARRFSREQFNREGVFLRIRPDNLRLFEGKVFFGLNRLQRDNEGGVFSDYELYRRGGTDDLPSVALAFAQSLICEEWIIKSSGDLQCKFRPELELPQRVRVRFYNEGFKLIGAISELKGSAEPLIVEVADQRVYQRTLKSKALKFSECLATAVSNILQSDFPHRSSAAAEYEFIAFIVLALLIFILSILCNLRVTMISVSLALVGWLLLDALLGIKFNFYTRPIEEWISLGVISFVAVMGRSRLDAARSQLIERAFSGYVNKDLLKSLVRGEQSLQLSGRKRELTCFLIDVAGFSKLIEKISPEQAFEAVKKIFAIIDPIILNAHGIIDKKTGDGIFGFFGDDFGRSSQAQSTKEAAVAAVRACFEVQERMKQVRPEDFGLGELPRLRIGINTGEMIVGNAGSEQHFNYTVLGESANFTQRLEAACIPGELLIGPRTAEFVKESFDLESTEIDVKNEKNKALAFKVRQPKRRAA